MAHGRRKVSKTFYGLKEPTIWNIECLILRIIDCADAKVGNMSETTFFEQYVSLTTHANKRRQDYAGKMYQHHAAGRQKEG